MPCWPSRATLAVCVCICLLSVPATGWAQIFEYRILPDVPAGMPGNTNPLGINDSGTVVGWFPDPAGRFHGFRWDDGVYSVLDAAPGTDTLVSAINDKGDIVGIAFDAPCGRPFKLSGGQYVTLPIPRTGCQTIAPTGINNHGVVVGTFTDDFFSRSFILSPDGAFTILSIPPDMTTSASGVVYTFAYGVNDAGTVVGAYQDDAGFHAFEYSGGRFRRLELPGCGDCSGSLATGINNAGTILLKRASPTDPIAFWLMDGGVAVPFSVPGATIARGSALSNSGRVTGIHQDANNRVRPFVANGSTIVDPLPALWNGSSFVRSPQELATLGRPVRAVAADGATQVLLRIPGPVGTRYTVTLLNDHSIATRSTSADEDGALGTLDDNDEPTGSQASVMVDQQGYAYAVYRAPDDFARPSGYAFKSVDCGKPGSDADLDCRRVTFRVESENGLSATVPLKILRPPVVLIHGLWSNWETWHDFAPLVTGPNTVDPRFRVGRVSYDRIVGEKLIGSDPELPASLLRSVNANALGLEFNVPRVLAQMEQWLAAFKLGSNGQGVPAAAVQSDVVTHSMGGLITRAMAYEKSFAENTFGKGRVHKLITISTPHLGSQVARHLVTTPAADACVGGLMQIGLQFALRSAHVPGKTYSGAIADLRGDDHTGDKSQAILRLQLPAPTPLTMARVGGYAESFSFLDFSPSAAFIRSLSACQRDPLAQALTAAGWPAVFHHHLNDGMVSVPSQFNALPPANGALSAGFVHSNGLNLLGIFGQNVLGPGAVSDHVIFLLNTPRTDTGHFRRDPQ